MLLARLFQARLRQRRARQRVSPHDVRRRVPLVQPTSAWWVRYGKGRRAEGGADVRELLQRTMYLQHLEVLDELRRPRWTSLSKATGAFTVSAGCV